MTTFGQLPSLHGSLCARDIYHCSSPPARRANDGFGTSVLHVLQHVFEGTGMF